MTDTKKCPFCGSEKIKIETPYIDRITGEHKTTLCCLSQKKNQEFLDKRYSNFYGEKPTMEDLANK